MLRGPWVTAHPLESCPSSAQNRLRTAALPTARLLPTPHLGPCTPDSARSPPAWRTPPSATAALGAGQAPTSCPRTRRPSWTPQDTGVGRAPCEGGRPGCHGTRGWAGHPMKVAVLDAAEHGGGQGTPCLRAAPQPHRGPCGAHSALMPRFPLLSADRPLVRTPSSLRTASVCAAGEAPGRGEEGTA